MTMQLIDHLCETPREYLALDELALAKAETGELGETLRFWEPRGYFAVVGRAGIAADDCAIDECRRDGVTIERRISGGGTVLEGPGCVNYSLVLSYESDPSYRGLKGSYEAVLGPIARRFNAMGVAAAVLPVSDLAVDGKKISGNAQVRKKSYFLQHGTMLFDMDLAKVSRYLTHPSREPAYRRGREHDDFIANIPLSRLQIEDAIKDVFSVTDPAWRLGRADLERLNDLVEGKFATDAWRFMF